MLTVRLMTWCASTVSGMHMAAFAAAEGGLFAEHGLEVEFVAAAKAPDFSLPGFTARVKAVAVGDADLALTAVPYLLAAQCEAQGRLPVRFIAICHQRNPIAGVVREDSGMRAPEDLPGARTALWSMPWFAHEYAGALDYLDLGAPELIDTPGRLDRAMGEREIEVVPIWMDETTQARLQDMTVFHEGQGFGLRAIPLDIPVYSTGLVAADRVPPDVADAARDAFVAGHELQREQPEIGLAGFRRHFPRVSAEHARANWDIYEPYAFDGVAPTSMNADRWQETIAYAARAHNLSTVSPDRMYRPELLVTAPAPVAAG